jgi:hypothetical protein
MTWIKTNFGRNVPFLFAMSLILLLISLAACGTTASTTSTGGSNISTTSQQTTAQPGTTAPTTGTATAGASSSQNGSGLKNVNQQVQNAVQGINSAQNDVTTSDGSSGQDNGQQP